MATFKGKQCRVILDRDPVAIRVGSGWYVLEIGPHDEPLITAIRDDQLVVEKGRAVGHQFTIDKRNLTGR